LNLQNGYLYIGIPIGVKGLDDEPLQR